MSYLNNLMCKKITPAPITVVFLLVALLYHCRIGSQVKFFLRTGLETCGHFIEIVFIENLLSSVLTNFDSEMLSGFL